MSVALVWMMVTGRYLNRMLEPARVKGAARVIALGLLAVAAYGAGLAVAGMVVPGTYAINSGQSGLVEVETGP